MSPSLCVSLFSDLIPSLPIVTSLSDVPATLRQLLPGVYSANTLLLRHKLVAQDAPCFHIRPEGGHFAGLLRSAPGGVSLAGLSPVTLRALLGNVCLLVPGRQP